MEIRTDHHTAQWNHAGSHIIIEVPSLQQALFSKQLNAVITLCGGEKRPNVLACYDLYGNKITEIKETADCRFNCLGANRGMDVAVMATAYINGWRDWWYSIDIEDGKLTSLGEGR